MSCCLRGTEANVLVHMVVSLNQLDTNELSVFLLDSFFYTTEDVGQFYLNIEENLQ